MKYCLLLAVSSYLHSSLHAKPAELTSIISVSYHGDASPAAADESGFTVYRVDSREGLPGEASK